MPGYSPRVWLDRALQCVKLILGNMVLFAVASLISATLLPIVIVFKLAREMTLALFTTKRMPVSVRDQVVVAGAASVEGQAVVLHFATAGCNVFACDNNVIQLTRLFSDLPLVRNLQLRAGDARDIERVREAVQSSGLNTIAVVYVDSMPTEEPRTTAVAATGAGTSAGAVTKPSSNPEVLLHNLTNAVLSEDLQRRVNGPIVLARELLPSLLSACSAKGLSRRDTSRSTPRCILVNKHMCAEAESQGFVTRASGSASRSLLSRGTDYSSPGFSSGSSDMSKPSLSGHLSRQLSRSAWRELNELFGDRVCFGTVDIHQPAHGQQSQTASSAVLERSNNSLLSAPQRFNGVGTVDGEEANAENKDRPRKPTELMRLLNDLADAVAGSAVRSEVHIFGVDENGGDSGPSGGDSLWRWLWFDCAFRDWVDLVVPVTFGLRRRIRSWFSPVTHPVNGAA